MATRPLGTAFKDPISDWAFSTDRRRCVHRSRAPCPPRIRPRRARCGRGARPRAPTQEFDWRLRWAGRPTDGWPPRETPRIMRPPENSRAASIPLKRVSDRRRSAHKRPENAKLASTISLRNAAGASAERRGWRPRRSCRSRRSFPAGTRGSPSDRSRGRGPNVCSRRTATCS